MASEFIVDFLWRDTKVAHPVSVNDSILKDGKKEGEVLEFYKVGPTFYIVGHAQIGCRHGIHKKGVETWSSNWVVGFVLLNLDACVVDDMLIEKRWEKITSTPIEVQINQNFLSSRPPLEPPNLTLHARAVGHSQLSHNG